MNAGAQQMETPQLIKVDQVSDGWIKKYVLTYRLPNGREFAYEAVSRKKYDAYLEELRNMASDAPHMQAPDAVCIVPRTRSNELVLIREFRYPLNSWCIAFPAGLVEPGESLESAVERELSEETGYALARDEQGCAHVNPLSQPGFSSAGMSEETVQVVYVHVEDEPACEPHTEPTECIEVFKIAVPEVPHFLETNTTPIGTRAQLILEAFSRNVQRYGA
ncbi:NUDIX domain-containing protein [Denitrobacterium detoxificans]|jgi:ADP-ribose pyrophosphatase|uniref:NUDIX domain-containing protein n=1 Tax=Denitrobacterium detoxificans TaxID=79604 RepID=UPI0026EBB379|nr:NUDIX hydrolase [Denitrobacterium detoxificans]